MILRRREEQMCGIFGRPDGSPLRVYFGGRPYGFRCDWRRLVRGYIISPALSKTKLVMRQMKCSGCCKRATHRVAPTMISVFAILFTLQYFSHYFVGSTSVPSVAEMKTMPRANAPPPTRPPVPHPHQRRHSPAADSPRPAEYARRSRARSCPAPNPASPRGWASAAP